MKVSIETINEFADFVKNHVKNPKSWDIDATVKEVEDKSNGFDLIESGQADSYSFELKPWQTKSGKLEVFDFYEEDLIKEN